MIICEMWNAFVSSFKEDLYLKWITTVRGRRYKMDEMTHKIKPNTFIDHWRIIKSACKTGLKIPRNTCITAFKLCGLWTFGVTEQLYFIERASC